jgi:hypothetical protein
MYLRKIIIFKKILFFLPDLTIYVSLSSLQMFVRDPTIDE